MKIVTTFFKYKNYPHEYDYLLKVLESSCQHYMPDIPFVCLQIDDVREKTDRHIGYHANTVKLRELAQYVKYEYDDLIIIDCDMMCLAPGYNAFDEIFDIAYTMRTTINGPGTPTLNGGVIMVRNNHRAKSWFSELLNVNEWMYSIPALHDKWRYRYPGMNQSAMGYMIEEFRHPAILHEYKTCDWNAVDCDWKKPGNPVFVHCKGDLRELIKRRLHPGPLAKLVERWYSFYDENN